MCESRLRGGRGGRGRRSKPRSAQPKTRTPHTDVEKKSETDPCSAIRMARERRGAGSSLVSMETQFYKQYMKDVL